MLREELNELVRVYDLENSNENLNAIKTFLRKYTIYFKKYYENAEGKNPILLTNYSEKGSFEDFTKNSNYQVPSLLMVKKEDGMIVYVSLNDFFFE